MYDSVKAGHPLMLDNVETFADGIAVKQPGDLTFSLVEEYVDDVVTVTEDEIAATILALIEKQKVIAEGAGAVAVTAVLFDKLPIEGKKVACIVSGRQYRREYPQSCHNPWTGHQWQERQSDHRTDP